MEPDNPDLRVSDAERDAAATELREHYAAGRLESHEFEERLNAIYAAKTQGQLSALNADLPALPPKPPTTAELARNVVASNQLARHIAVGGGAFVLSTVVWLSVGAHGDFWPKWVLIATAVVIWRGSQRGRHMSRSRRHGRGRGGDYEYHYEYNYKYGSDRGDRDS